MRTATWRGGRRCRALPMIIFVSNDLAGKPDEAALRQAIHALPE
ncbi:hypothetical protein [Microlunatus sp. GCM10028923]